MCRPSHSRFTQVLHLVLLLLFAVSASNAIEGICPKSCVPIAGKYEADEKFRWGGFYGSYNRLQCQKKCIEASPNITWGQVSSHQCDCYTGCDALFVTDFNDEYISFKASGCPPPIIKDDPHFVGALGTHFDFNGELGNTYCLVTDRSLHINGLFDGYQSDSVVGASVSAKGKGMRSWIRELGIIWKDASGMKHSLRLVPKRGKVPDGGQRYLAAVEVDGVGVAVPSSLVAVVKGNELSFTFTGSRKMRSHVEETYLLVINGRAKVKISLAPASPRYQLPDDSEIHFNLAFPMLKATNQTHGILGQTYRDTAAQAMKALKYSALARLMGEPIKADGPSGQGFLDGTPGDYVSSSITAPDCKFSAFEHL